MPKRKKTVKTVEQLDADISRWTTRLRRAMGRIEQLQRQRKRLLTKPATPKPTPEETPKVGWVFPEVKDIIDRDTRGTDAPKEVDPTTQLGLLGPAPGFNAKGERVPDDLDDIPTFLQRPKMSPEAEAIVKRLAETKKIKASNRSAIRRERKERDAIPKSKRRWDTSKSRWISD